MPTTQPTKSLTQMGSPAQQTTFPWDRFDVQTAAAERRRAVVDLGAQGVFDRIYERADTELGYFCDAQYFAVYQTTQPATGAPVTTLTGWWLIFSNGQKDEAGKFKALSSTSIWVAATDGTASLQLPNVHLVRTAFDQPDHTGSPNEPQDT